MPKAKGGSSGSGGGGGLISRTVRAAGAKFTPAPQRGPAALSGTGSGVRKAGPAKPRPGAATGKAAGTKRWPASRPKYKAGLVDEVWRRALDKDGRVFVKGVDGNDREVVWKPGQPRKGVWDMGHKPSHEYRDLRQDYWDGKITKDQFIAQYQDADNYFVEDPLRNQSHVDEKGRKP